MRRITAISGCLLVILIAQPVFAKDTHKNLRPLKFNSLPATPTARDLDNSLDPHLYRSSAQADTFILGYWDFEGYGVGDPQGWTSHDRTEQDDCYWHVDDFSGLDGGDYGRLIVLEGSRSLWCGARPDTNSNLLCGYATLPGYGNGWDQSWIFRCIQVPDTEAVYIDYLASWDSEPGYDGTHVEFATKNTCDSLGSLDDINISDWTELRVVDGVQPDTISSDTIPSGHKGAIKIRFRFTSDGAWSDYDGLWDTDGAIILDSITVRGEFSGVIDFEDFEDEAIGDKTTADGDWECGVLSGYGEYAGLVHGSSMVQEDPCTFNASYLWAFINGSTETYACGGHPEQMAVPMGNERGQYINNEIWSPPVPFSGTGATVQLVFDVYRDLPIPNLVFYVWYVRSIVDGCPLAWRDRNYCCFPMTKDWLRAIANIGDLVDPGADSVQVALGCLDMCNVWCTVYGNGDCHSHSPLFDNVELWRISVYGPQWSVRDIDIFQDTFPTNGTAMGTGRVDAAIDRAPSASSTIYAGDSASVLCSDPSAGLATDPYTGFGGAVYCYFSISPPNQPGKMSPVELEENHFRWPLVDSIVCDGKTWYQFRCDTAFAEYDIPRTNPVPDKWCIDLNDNVITNGDTLEFFFGAVGNTHTTYWSQGSGTVLSIEAACKAPMEMQILPGGGYERGGDILYVDAFSGRGGQPYFDSAFKILGIDSLVDRYDVRGPSSIVANRPGARVTNVNNQLINIYRKIIWHSGDLSFGGAPGDGTGDPEKSDDFLALYTFLDQHTSTDGAGIYFNGDDLAQEWISLGYYGATSASLFRDTYMPFDIVTGDHVTTHGVSPLVIGTDGGIFDDGSPLEEDTLVANGSCPIINDFDQIQPVAGTTLEMTYSGTGLATDGAVVAYDTVNALGNPARVVLSGFSFHYINDDRPAGIPDRADHLSDILNFLGNETTPTDINDRPAFSNHLAQNYPNPFNPTTTIRYSIKERARVTLKVYNVAGQLVRTLVNEDQTPRQGGFAVQWHGRNNTGQPVSSGVYFYRLAAGSFVKTRKMVIMK